MSMQVTREQFVGTTYSELLVENAKLREQLASLIDRSIRMADKMNCLDAENAKLRELASVLAHCAADSGCDSCPINGGCAQVRELDLCETVHDRMRELGVEP